MVIVAYCMYHDSILYYGILQNTASQSFQFRLGLCIPLVPSSVRRSSSEARKPCGATVSSCTARSTSPEDIKSFNLPSEAALTSSRSGITSGSKPALIHALDRSLLISDQASWPPSVNGRGNQPVSSTPLTPPSRPQRAIVSSMTRQEACTSGPLGFDSISFSRSMMACNG